MDRGDWRKLVDQLRGAKYQFCLGGDSHRIDFDAGLTDVEIAATETRFGFRFPPDLRAFLHTALPRGPSFPDWRSGEESAIREWLDLPRQGILFDIEHNGFWLEEWGPRPASLEEACRVASELVAAAPKLIPIFGHRMMPDEPHLSGNPVFSIHQTDIIHFGFDLADYLRHEFRPGWVGWLPWPARERCLRGVRPIRFWEIDRFQVARWAGDPRVFDNSRGPLP
jgi:hypothetical protein